MPQTKPSTTILQRQFTPALQMLEAIITACPDDLWHANPRGQPIWKRILHTLESLDYFLNDFDRYIFDDFNGAVSAEFDHHDAKQLQKTEMLKYFNAVSAKCAKAFSALADNRLSVPSQLRSDLAYLDIFMLQLRHIALNTGRCHQAFAANGIKIPGWKGFGE